MQTVRVCWVSLYVLMTLRACGCCTSPSQRLSWKASQWVSLCHGLGACEELRAQTEEAQASTNSHFFNRNQTCQLYFSIIHLLFIKGKKEYICNDKTANKRVFKVRKLLKSLNFSMIIFPKNNTADLMHTDLIAGHVVTVSGFIAVIVEWNYFNNWNKK